MPLECEYSGCTGAVKLTDTSGDVHDRVEEYECEYGHSFIIRLEA